MPEVAAQTLGGLDRLTHARPDAFDLTPSSPRGVQVCPILELERGYTFVDLRRGKRAMLQSVEALSTSSDPKRGEMPFSQEAGEDMAFDVNSSMGPKVGEMGRFRQLQAAMGRDIRRWWWRLSTPPLRGQGACVNVDGTWSVSGRELVWVWRWTVWEGREELRRLCGRVPSRPFVPIFGSAAVASDEGSVRGV